MTDNETYASTDFINKSADYQLANLFYAPGHRNEYLLKRITSALADLSSGIEISNEEIEYWNNIYKHSAHMEESDPVYKLMLIFKKTIKNI